MTSITPSNSKIGFFPQQKLQYRNKWKLEQAIKEASQGVKLRDSHLFGPGMSEVSSTLKECA